jgi:RHS repeat-associated protein
MATQKQTSLLATSITQSVITTVNTDNVSVRSYSPFGFLNRHRSIDATCAFNGCYHEPATHTYLLGNGYRAFNPLLMRFHSPDSLSPFAEGGLNAYAYVGNDPANRIDPSGHFSINLVKLHRRLTKGSIQKYVPIGTPADNITIKTSTYTIKEVGVLGPEAFWSSDYYKGDKTLFIYAHGGNGKINISKKYKIEAADLVHLLKSNNVLPGNYKRIHLLSCRLGAGSGYSFAKDLHTLTGLKIKAYENDLFTTLAPDKIAKIVLNSQNIPPNVKIPINKKITIFKYKLKHIRHAQKVQPGADVDVYSPRYIR